MTDFFDEAWELMEGYQEGAWAPDANGTEPPDKRDNRDNPPRNGPARHSASSVVTVVTDVRGIPWETPAPLTRAPKLPAFPIDALPDLGGGPREAVAQFTQTPMDLAATVALAAIATAVGGRIRVRVRPVDRTHQPVHRRVTPTGVPQVGGVRGDDQAAVRVREGAHRRDEPTIIEAETLIDIAKADADRAKTRRCQGRDRHREGGEEAGGADARWHPRRDTRGGSAPAAADRRRHHSRKRPPRCWPTRADASVSCRPRAASSRSWPAATRASPTWTCSSRATPETPSGWTARAAARSSSTRRP